MAFEEYEYEVMSTAKVIDNFPGRCLKGVLGLVSEAGEVAGLYEKMVFQDQQVDEEELKKELGDTLWYLTYLILANGWTLQEIMEDNTAKLRERYPKGRFDAEDSTRRINGG